MSRDATQEELAKIEAGIRTLVDDMTIPQRRKVVDSMIDIHTQWGQPRVVDLLQRLKRELATE